MTINNATDRYASAEAYKGFLLVVSKSQDGYQVLVGPPLPEGLQPHHLGVTFESVPQAIQAAQQWCDLTIIFDRVTTNVRNLPVAGDLGEEAATRLTNLIAMFREQVWQAVLDHPPAATKVIPPINPPRFCKGQSVYRSLGRQWATGIIQEVQYYSEWGYLIDDAWESEDYLFRDVECLLYPEYQPFANTYRLSLLEVDGTYQWLRVALETGEVVLGAFLNEDPRTVMNAAIQTAAALVLGDAADAEDVDDA